MSLLTWTVSDKGDHYADFGRGRYSVARTHGRVPRFVARWHRSRGPVTQGQNITGATTARSSQSCMRGTRSSGRRYDGLSEMRRYTVANLGGDDGCCG